MLPQLAHKELIIQDVKDAVAAGKIVTISQSMIHYKGWTGTGYILIGFGAPAVFLGSMLIILSLTLFLSFVASELLISGSEFDCGSRFSTGIGAGGVVAVHTFIVQAINAALPKIIQLIATGKASEATLYMLTVFSLITGMLATFGKKYAKSNSKQCQFLFDMEFLMRNLKFFMKHMNFAVKIIFCMLYIIWFFWKLSISFGGNEEHINEFLIFSLILTTIFIYLIFQFFKIRNSKDG